jgi:hypothetical protein
VSFLDGFRAFISWGSENLALIQIKFFVFGEEIDLKRRFPFRNEMAHSFANRRGPSERGRVVRALQHRRMERFADRASISASGAASRQYAGMTAATLAGQPK